CHFTTSFWPKTETIFTKLLFEDGAKLLTNGLLYNSVHSRWYTQFTHFSVIFWYFHPQSRQWLIFSFSYLISQFIFMFPKMMRYIVDGYPIYTSCSFISVHLFISFIHIIITQTIF